jgi:hypothetical protein
MALEPPRIPDGLGAALVLEALGRRRRVRLDFRGGSMEPWLRAGDRILVGPAPAALRPGDVVLYRSRGVFVAHRVLRAGPREVEVKGDFTARGAQRLPRAEVLGLVLVREREGAAVDLRSPLWLSAGRVASRLSPWAVRLALALPKPARRAARGLATAFLDTFLR